MNPWEVTLTHRWHYRNAARELQPAIPGPLEKDKPPAVPARDISRAMIDTFRARAYIFSRRPREMDSNNFGEHLKREREMRGVSLEEISAATRISIRFLEALENEQWERLPGGIFNRGFIRAVARFLGLDEEGLIAEYALETRERPEIAIWTKEPVHKSRGWIAGGTLFVVLCALGAGGWYSYQRYGATFQIWHKSHPIFKTFAAWSRGRPSGNVATAQSPGPPGVAPPSPLTGAPAQTAVTSTISHAATKTPASPVPISVAPAPFAQSPLELKIEAGETSHVIVLADGKTVFSGRLESQHTLSFQAHKSFKVFSSKSNAVLLELNGRTVPPLGTPGQPGSITLTRDNLKPKSGGNN